MYQKKAVEIEKCDSRYDFLFEIGHKLYEAKPCI